MRELTILTLLVLHFGCIQDIKTKSYSQNVSVEVSRIDQLIVEKDTYKYMGDIRYPSYSFNETDFPLFDSNFVQSLVMAYYDTLTRKIIRIGILSYKHTNSSPSRIDDFYFDDSNQLIKIDVLTPNTSPQHFASYYFQSNRLIYEKTKAIEVKDLNSYLNKIDNIYKVVRKKLLNKELID